MKFRFALISPILLILMVLSCAENQDDSGINEQGEYDWKTAYTKHETYITMRDGVRLFTTIYTPNDTSTTYPVILKRTPYSCQPYGLDTLPGRISHNKDLVEESKRE